MYKLYASVFNEMCQHATQLHQRRRYVYHRFRLVTHKTKTSSRTSPEISPQPIVDLIFTKILVADYLLSLDYLLFLGSAF